MNVTKHFWGDVLIACYLIAHIYTVHDGQKTIFCSLLQIWLIFFTPYNFFIKYVLYMIIAPIQTNWILKHSNVYFLGNLKVKKNICATILSCINLWSLQKLHFLSTPYFSKESFKSISLEPEDDSFLYSFQKTHLHMLMLIVWLRYMAKYIPDVSNPLLLCQLSLYLQSC